MLISFASFFFRGSVCAAVIVGLVSCSSLHEKVKPAPAAPSDFLQHAGELKPAPGYSPFLLNWSNPKPSKTLLQKQRLYIAPVTVKHLRPMSKVLANSESTEAKQHRAAHQLADYARDQFGHAFGTSPAARYQVVPQEGRDTMTLELALVELNPNTVTGAVVRTGVNAVALPGTDLVLAKAARPFKGNIALEGRLRDSLSGEVLFEFSDQEESKSAFFFNLRDFTSYGQARLAIREWATQFESLTRTPTGTKVKDSSPLTFRLW